MSNRLRDLTITAVARGQWPLHASWAYAPFHDACSLSLEMIYTPRSSESLRPSYDLYTTIISVSRLLESMLAYRNRNKSHVASPFRGPRLRNDARTFSAA